MGFIVQVMNVVMSLLMEILSWVRLFFEMSTSTQAIKVKFTEEDPAFLIKGDSI